MAGFGRNPFGRNPFGHADDGRDFVIKSFPTEYFDDTLVLDANESIKDNNKDPLLKVLKTYANSVYNRSIEIQSLPTLIDYETAPLEIVRLWGDMLGLGIDKNDPEFLQRSFLGNASQWLQIKSSYQGYSIRGLASGFEVLVGNFWRLDPIYEPLIPPRYKFWFKPKTADAGAVKMFHTDQPPGTFPGTPTEENPTYTKSAYVKLVFMAAEPRKDNIDYNMLLDLVIDKIRDVVGIHHEMLPPEFRINVKINVGEKIGTLRWEEDSFVQLDEPGEFDTTPADVHAVDQWDITVDLKVGAEFDQPFTIGVNSSVDMSITVMNLSGIGNVPVVPTMGIGFQTNAFTGVSVNVGVTGLAS